jgi:hypothetical protein
VGADVVMTMEGAGLVGPNTIMADRGDCAKGQGTNFSRPASLRLADELDETNPVSP